MCGIHLACVQTSTIAFVLKARIQLKMWVKFHSDDELYSNRWSVSDWSLLARENSTNKIGWSMGFEFSRLSNDQLDHLY